MNTGMPHQITVGKDITTMEAVVIIRTMTQLVQLEGDERRGSGIPIGAEVNHDLIVLTIRPRELAQEDDMVVLQEDTTASSKTWARNNTT